MTGIPFTGALGGMLSGSMTLPVTLPRNVSVTTKFASVFCWTWNVPVLPARPRALE